MKLLAYTDIHGNSAAFATLKKKAKEADIIVDCGDFTVFAHNITKILKTINSLGKQVLLVTGNHEEHTNVAPAVKANKNIFYLERNFYEYEGYLFIGYGGGGFAHEDRSFEIFMNDNKKKWQGKKIILVLHQPPYGTALDDLGYPVGNMTFRRWIEQHQPALVLAGHIHENFFEQDKIGESIIVNPGPTGTIFEIDEE
ncbi:MAG: metallophosphoesterase [Candidatus Woesearchaeota archaeon]|nr:MAG: metallophosphoesterase [Candidatus Woesearchaeota archaeon]